MAPARHAHAPHAGVGAFMILGFVAFVMAALGAHERRSLWRGAALAVAAATAARAAGEAPVWLAAPGAGWVIGSLRTRGRIRVERLRELRARRQAVASVAETLLPRGEIVAIPLGARVADALAAAVARPHAWYPVHEGDLDRICGIVGLADLASADRRGGVRALLHPALFVPEAQKPAETLALLRERSAGLAIVVDEHGRTAGLISSGDIAAAALGESRSEWASPVAVPAERGTWIVSGAMRKGEFERAFETRLPAGRYETLAGLILWRLGRMPGVGERVSAGRALLTVETATRQAVVAVKVSLPR